MLAMMSSSSRVAPMKMRVSAPPAPRMKSGSLSRGSYNNTAGMLVMNVMITARGKVNAAEREPLDHPAVSLGRGASRPYSAGHPAQRPPVPKLRLCSPAHDHVDRRRDRLRRSGRRVEHVEVAAGRQLA